MLALGVSTIQMELRYRWSFVCSPDHLPPAGSLQDAVGWGRGDLGTPCLGALHETLSVTRGRPDLMGAFEAGRR